MASLLSLLFWAAATEGKNQISPWFLSFSSNGKQPFACSGALVAGNWIATAANCNAKLGDEIDLLSRTMLIEKIVLHPQHASDASENNIALYKLSSQPDVVPVQISTISPSSPSASLEMSACTKSKELDKSLCLTSLLTNLHFYSKWISQSTDLDCGTLTSCGACASSKRPCYWCPLMKTCMGETQWLADQDCPRFVFSNDECTSRPRRLASIENSTSVVENGTSVQENVTSLEESSENASTTSGESLENTTDVAQLFISVVNSSAGENETVLTLNTSEVRELSSFENETTPEESASSESVEVPLTLNTSKALTLTSDSENTTELIPSILNETSVSLRSLTPASGEDPTMPPTSAPVDQPTSAPVDQPTSAPVDQPTSAPVDQPTSAPVDQPTSAPVDQPTSAPVDTTQETMQPSLAPVVEVTLQPSSAPVDEKSIPEGSGETALQPDSEEATTTPTAEPASTDRSLTVTSSPTGAPTTAPTAEDTVETIEVTSISTESEESSQESPESTNRSVVASPTIANSLAPTTEAPPTSVGSSVEASAETEDNEPTPATPLTPPSSLPPTTLPAESSTERTEIGSSEEGTEMQRSTMESSEGSEPSSSEEGSISTSVPATTRGIDDCQKLTNCSACAGASYTDQNKRASCVWCGSSNSCISAAAYDSKAACQAVSFGPTTCPGYADSDRCVTATGCSQCVVASYFKPDRSFQQCVWCGSSCIAQSNADASKCSSTCKADVASVKTCRELKWLVAPGSKSCSSGKLDGQCGTVQTFAQAEAWCLAAGARLCSSSELANVNVANTGCSLEQQRVWTGTACVGGHTSQSGAKFYENSVPARCDSDSETFKPVCCADDPVAAKIPAPMATKSCKQLGWKVTPGSPKVCSQSTFPGGICLRSVDFRTAQGQCFSAGARLCNVAELANNEAKGSGCKLDDENSWTSTPCPGGVMVAKGSFSTSSAKCTDLAQSAAVRCCADGTDVDQVTCEDLGWVVKKGVCSTAKVSGRCPDPMDFVDAFNTCFEIGTRVCTAEQLQSGVGLLSPHCSAGNERVWSMTKCPGGYITVSGDGSQVNPPQCSAATSSFPVRCCAVSKAQRRG